MARLTPQGRVQVAKNLRRMSNLPGLTVKQRQQARYHASSLMATNLAEAQRQRQQQSPTPQPEPQDDPAGPQAG